MEPGRLYRILEKNKEPDPDLALTIKKNQIQIRPIEKNIYKRYMNNEYAFALCHYFSEDDFYIMQSVIIDIFPFYSDPYN